MTLSEHALSGLQKLADSAAFPTLTVEERVAVRALLGSLRRDHDAN
jgi:hypothetical protein